ncbi:MAG: FxLYD domain-containing protein, partial [Candidatus Moraniibacteriota bacterium]
SQLTKRMAIIVGFVVLCLILGGLLYLLLSSKPTCFDGKQNQSEKSVDCGGVCGPCQANFTSEDLIIKEKTFVSGGNNTYDAIIKIANPNTLVGASSFHYIVELQDNAGVVLATREGDDFILPADGKYVAQLGLITTDNIAPTQLHFSIKQIKWSQLAKGIEKPQLNVYNKKFAPDASGLGSRAEGVIRNESGSDFKEISVVVILRDEKGNVLGVNTTQKDGLRARAEGDFTLTWPYAFSAAVQNMEVEAQTNVFEK